MRISIVTISFNQARFIEETILSIINQDYEDLEYIIVDPGSTDGSREIINSYEDSISEIIFEADNGPADGLNKGFSKASGEIVGFVNSDDLLLPNALRTVANFFKFRNNCDILIGNGLKIDDSGNLIKRVYADKFSLKKFACGAFNFTQPSIFIRLSAFRKTTGFNISNSTCWDGELIVDMALSGAKIRKENVLLSAFRYYPNSISGSGANTRMYLEDRERIFKKIMGRERKWHDDYLKNFYRFSNIISNPLKLISKFSMFK